MFSNARLWEKTHTLIPTPRRDETHPRVVAFSTEGMVEYRGLTNWTVASRENYSIVRIRNSKE